LFFFWDRDPNFVKPLRPSSFHHSDIRKNDLKIGVKTKFIYNNFNPANTLIITVSTFWSPYMYHLKEYRQYSIEALFTRNEKFQDYRRDSFMWDVREYQTKARKFKVPKGVNKLLLVDDELNIKLVNFQSEVHTLPGNSTVVEIDVKGGDTIQYGYNLLKRV
jgi:hypothetical protein